MGWRSGRLLFNEVLQVISLSKHGHVIGSHSHTHRQMMTSLCREELLEDWRTSLEYLEALLDTQVTVASLPNGYCSQTILEVLNELGVIYIYFHSYRQS